MAGCRRRVGERVASRPWLSCALGMGLPALILGSEELDTDEDSASLGRPRAGGIEQLGQGAALGEIGAKALGVLGRADAFKQAPGVDG